MKILMIGWEYPPHITGGLGTACYWLNKALIAKGIQIEFITANRKIKKIHKNQAYISGDNIAQVPVSNASYEILNTTFFNKIEISTDINPYPHQKGFTHSNLEKLLAEINGGKLKTQIENAAEKYAQQVLKAIGNRSFDIIHAHDWPTYRAAALLKTVTEKPLIVHVHSTELDRMTMFSNSAIYNIEKEGFELADKIITVSNFTKNTLIKHYHIHKDKISVIYNGVPEGFNGYVSPASLPNFDEKLVTFCGRITQQKGPVYFVNAAYKLLEKSNNVRFIMAGEGNQKEEMIELTAELGISRKFHFPGFLNQAQVKDLFSITDLLVMPSISEPFGFVAVEAISAGLPVIVSKESGVSEILKNISQVDYWETEALADEMLKLLLHPNLGKRKVLECQKVLQDYKWDNVAENVKTLYNDTLLVAH